ncbi:Protein of unknown function [Bacillus cereus]|jgi:hypothetical protein
MFF